LSCVKRVLESRIRQKKVFCAACFKVDYHLDIVSGTGGHANLDSVSKVSEVLEKLTLIDFS
jgi:hypothetical protein